MIPQTVWIGADALTHAETDICVLGNKALIAAGQSMIRQGHMKNIGLYGRNDGWTIKCAELTGS